MIHYKDLSWNEKETELEKYKKNQSVKFRILEANKQDGDEVSKTKVDPFTLYIN